MVKCRNIWDECQFPEEVGDDMLLYRIIFGVRNEYCQCKVLSKCKYTTFEKALGLIWAMEVTDANCIKVHKNETETFDTVCKSFGWLCIKERCYNCSKQDEEDHAHVLFLLLSIQMMGVPVHSLAIYPFIPLLPSSHSTYNYSAI